MPTLRRTIRFSAELGNMTTDNDDVDACVLSTSAHNENIDACELSIVETHNTTASMIVTRSIFVSYFFVYCQCTSNFD
jgi:hypothetical protein